VTRCLELDAAEAATEANSENLKADVKQANEALVVDDLADTSDDDASPRPPVDELPGSVATPCSSPRQPTARHNLAAHGKRTFVTHHLALAYHRHHVVRRGFVGVVAVFHHTRGMPAPPHPRASCSRRPTSRMSCAVCWSRRRAYAAIVDAVERRAPTARLDGVVVAEHVPVGLDVHAGVLRLRGGQQVVFARPHAGTQSTGPILALCRLHHEAGLSMAHAVLSRITALPPCGAATTPMHRCWARCCCGCGGSQSASRIG